MIPENTFNLILIVFFGFLLIFSFGLAVYFFRFKKKMDLFFNKGGKDIEDLLEKQIKELEKQEEEIKKIFEEILRLKEISQKSFQKIGLIRYNPFKGVGGDQSFSVALLDLDNNGFVITSIYGRDGNRVYAKPVDKGKSGYSLSEEEKKAIKKAIE